MNGIGQHLIRRAGIGVGQTAVTLLGRQTAVLPVWEGELGEQFCRAPSPRLGNKVVLIPQERGCLKPHPTEPNEFIVPASIAARRAIDTGQRLLPLHRRQTVRKSSQKPRCMSGDGGIAVEAESWVSPSG